MKRQVEKVTAASPSNAGQQCCSQAQETRFTVFEPEGCKLDFRFCIGQECWIVPSTNLTFSQELGSSKGSAAGASCVNVFVQVGHIAVGP